MLCIAPTQTKAPQTPLAESQTRKTYLSKVREVFSKIPLDKNPLSLATFYQIVHVSLLTSSGVGGVGVVILLFSPVPGIFPLFCGGLSLECLIAAYIIQQASLAQTFGEHNQTLKIQVDAFTDQNANLKQLSAKQQAVITTQAENFASQRATLKAEIFTFTSQNTNLARNIECLTKRISELTLQDEAYRATTDRFKVGAEQFLAGNLKDKETFSKQLAEFGEQTSSLQAVWDQVSKEAFAFSNHHTEQLTKLKEILEQLNDPKTTFLRLKEHQEINNQIQGAVSRLELIQKQLASVEALVAMREGQVQERDALLTNLKKELSEILSSYRMENKELAELIEGIAKLASRTKNDDFDTKSVSCGTT